MMHLALGCNQFKLQIKKYQQEAVTFCLGDYRSFEVLAAHFGLLAVL